MESNTSNIHKIQAVSELSKTINEPVDNITKENEIETSMNTVSKELIDETIEQDEIDMPDDTNFEEDLINNSKDHNVIDTEELNVIEKGQEDNTMEENTAENGQVDVGSKPEINAQVQRLTRLPVARIKNIIKFDDDVTATSQESTFLITKATELFIEDFVKEVYQCTIMSKKKTISKKDVDTAIFNRDYFFFLDGALE